LGGEFQAKLQNLDMVPFTPYFQDRLPGNLGGLLLTFDARVTGTPSEVDLKGNLVLDRLDLSLDALPDSPVKNARLAVDYDLLADFGRERCDLHQLGLDYNGIKISARGSVVDMRNKPAVALALTLPQQQISKAFDAVPPEMVETVSALDPTGMVAAEAELAGNLDEPARLLKAATLDLQDVQVTAGAQRPAFSGRLKLAGDRLTSEALQARLGDNKADIALDAQHVFSRPVVVNADITSERFLLEPLFMGGAGSAVAADQSSGTARKLSTADELGPFNIPLQAKGVIKVAEALWKGLSIKDFLVQYELGDNVLNLTRMQGAVAGGSFSNTARVDLGRKGLAYTATVGLQAIQTDPLLTAFAPGAAGSFLGAMDLSLTVEGHGTQWQTLNRNLSGNGNFQVADGRLTSPGLIRGFNAFAQLPELDDISFRDFSGQFRIANGKAAIDSQMLSDSLKLFPNGTVGLDGSLNLRLDTRLSPALAKKIDRQGGILGYLADSEGWSRVPLLLKGSFASPSFGLDPKGVQEQAGKALSGELGRQIDKFFKKPDSQAQTTGQQQDAEPGPAEGPARQMLEDSLRKLFGD
jgi:AsmA protein